MDHNSIGVIAAVALVPLAILFAFWKYSRERTLIAEWANRNHYEIIHCEQRWFFYGPFMWTSSKSQTVYHVTIRDTHGKQRNAFIRCGGYFIGMLSSNVDVSWDTK